MRKASILWPFNGYSMEYNDHRNLLYMNVINVMDDWSGSLANKIWTPGI